MNYTILTIFLFSWLWPRKRDVDKSAANPFGRFTKSAYHVLTIVQNETKRRNHSDIGLEHLLLGLVLEEQGIAANILQTLQIDLNLMRERLENMLVPGQWSIREPVGLTWQLKKAIEFAVDEARSLGYSHIGTEHLLLGLLREGSGAANEILAELGITLDRVRAQLPLGPRDSPILVVSPTPPIYNKPPIIISPVFGLLVLLTIGAAYLTYQQQFNPGLTVFIFVTGGWLISLCLHEFGHALTAFWGGDREVVDKGYLTLNPFKYTHTVLSIVLPLLYLAMGGIGLPGGAVYINPGAIRSRGMLSLTSAAGPLATALCALVLSLPFAFGLAVADVYSHFEFWAGLAFLTSLQITALLFNLLPIPGLDGFGIIGPYLPGRILSGIQGFGAYTLLIIFMLFSNQSFRRGFWGAIRFILSLVNLDSGLVYEGLRLFQFWMN